MSAGAVEQSGRRNGVAAVLAAGPSWSAGALGRAADAQAGRLFLWCPVALAAGSGLYFALPGEPGLVLALVLGLAALVSLWLGRSVPLILLAGLVAGGFALAKAKSAYVATPLLAASTGEVEVTGTIVAVERASAKRLVIILTPSAIAGLPQEKVPRRLRLTLAATPDRPVPGAQVSLRAYLSPLPTPVLPGGYDQARRLWFDGIGGTGRVTSALTVLSAATPSAAGAVAAGLDSIRSLMGQRIHQALAEPYASFAEALITGERSTIPPEINRSLMVSGLFHILSISGLHMWLVAGGVFWGLRATLALVPALALGWPIKKWAAGAAVLAGLLYMLLADSGVATARSFIMVAVVFFAVMVDRPALSLRNLAIAALLVLLLDPEAAVEASFQMSFLAVLGLVAFHEAAARLKTARGREEGAPRHLLLRCAGWALWALGVSLATSFIAGTASSIPAAYHFGRVSPYGVLANGLAIPIVGIIVMPSALLAALLMLLGLEWLPLQLMAQGLALVMAVSGWVASLPGADEVVPLAGAGPVVLMAAGLVGVALLKGPVRGAGLVLLAIGAAWALRPAALPDVLIERAGANVALRDDHGLLVPAHARRARFSVAKWLVANGEEQSPAAAAKRPGWTCAADRCTAVVKGRFIVYVNGKEDAPLDCGRAAILIAAFPLRGRCAGVPLRIDRFDLWRSGAHAVFIGPEGVRVETARAAQGARPWVVKPERRATPFTHGSRKTDGPRD